MKLTPAQRQTLNQLEAIVRRGDRPGPFGRGAAAALRHTLEVGRRDAQDRGDLERVRAVLGRDEVAS